MFAGGSVDGYQYMRLPITHIHNLYQLVASSLDDNGFFQCPLSTVVYFHLQFFQLFLALCGYDYRVELGKRSQLGQQFCLVHSYATQYLVGFEGYLVLYGVGGIVARATLDLLYVVESEHLHECLGRYALADEFPVEVVYFPLVLEVLAR